YHAPVILMLVDFKYDSSLANLRKAATWIPRGSITSAVQHVMNMRPLANAGCASDGTLYLRRHPFVESDTFRSTVPVAWTWKAQDVRERIGFRLDQIMRVGVTWGSAFVWGAGNTTVGIEAWTG